jgi:hypothetical protein
LQVEQVRQARGHAKRPLSRDELARKFKGCLEFARSGRDPDKLFAQLERLEALASVRALVDSR